MSLEIFILGIHIAMGLVYGSFCSVLVSRLRSGEGGILTGRSRCPECGQILGALDLIPVVSWLLSGGRCRYCHVRIPIWYPILEISTGLVFALVLLGGVWTRDVDMLAPWLSAEWWWMMTLILALIPIAWYDILYGEIPDELSVPTAWACLVAVFAGWISGAEIPFFGDVALWEWVLASIAVYAFFLIQILIPGLVFALSRRRPRLAFELAASVVVFPIWMFLLSWRDREEPDDTHEAEAIPAWMGWGDLRLAFVMGLSWGWWAILGLAIAYVIGSIYAVFALISGRGRVVAFGPFLIVWLLVALAWGWSILGMLDGTPLWDYIAMVDF